MNRRLRIGGLGFALVLAVVISSPHVVEVRATSCSPEVWIDGSTTQNIYNCQTIRIAANGDCPENGGNFRWVVTGGGLDEIGQSQCQIPECYDYISWIDVKPSTESGTATVTVYFDEESPGQGGDAKAVTVHWTCAPGPCCECEENSTGPEIDPGTISTPAYLWANINNECDSITLSVEDAEDQDCIWAPPPDYGALTQEPLTFDWDPGSGDCRPDDAATTWWWPVAKGQTSVKCKVDDAPPWPQNGANDPEKYTPSVTLGGYEVKAKVFSMGAFQDTLMAVQGGGPDEMGEFGVSGPQLGSQGSLQKYNGDLYWYIKVELLTDPQGIDSHRTGTASANIEIDTSIWHDWQISDTDLIEVGPGWGIGIGVSAPTNPPVGFSFSLSWDTGPDDQEAAVGGAYAYTVTGGLGGMVEPTLRTAVTSSYSEGDLPASGTWSSQETKGGTVATSDLNSVVAESQFDVFLEANSRGPAGNSAIATGGFGATLLRVSNVQFIVDDPNCAPPEE